MDLHLKLSGKIAALVEKETEETGLTKSGLAKVALSDYFRRKEAGKQ
jgi:hypothetical protein